MLLTVAKARRLGLLAVLLLIASEMVARQPAGVDAAQPTPAGEDRPTLVYSTYYGSTDGEERHSTSGDALAIDASGHVYITGMTSSARLPLKNPYDPSHSGSLWDGFIAKLDPTGSDLVYGTYFGSGFETTAEGIAVDAQGNIYLTGSARRGFQARNSPIQDDVRGDADAFVAKFSPDGA
ncbi:MAG TPA: SBBP repeat-containing protein, partial [Chloroflexia bacterium]|nr:SBBP repeat-containing protein [Chloroflexia bacterium]